MKIKKYEPFPPALKKIIDHSGADIAVGAWYIDKKNNARIIRISEIEYIKKTKHQHEDVHIHYDEATDWECTEWEKSSYVSLDNFRDRYLKLDKTLQEHWDEALQVIKGEKTIEEYADHGSDNITTGNDNTSLISKNSKESLQMIQQHLEDKKKKAQMVMAFVGYEMEKRKQELENIKQGMYEVVAQFKDKIKRIMRVITTIELYLGVDEEIFQLQDGPRASEDTPISFRQQLLYMDEETGHWKDGGLDFNDIAWFDEWLIKNNNFKNLVPEEKGVVVFRPRRNAKNYGSGDAWVEALKNIENLDKTYLLIRNGECLFRIYTDKIAIIPRLFPRKKELQQIIDKYNDEEISWRHNAKEKKEALEDATYHYKQRATLLQGLIDRSEVFAPLPPQRPSIFKQEETPGAIQFIYDDEATLPSGRLPFEKWWDNINDKIAPGSRILITGEYDYERYGRRKDFSERFYLAPNSSEGLKNVPDLPKEGVYVVEEFTTSYTHTYRETEYKKKIEELKKSGTKYVDLGIKKGKVWAHPDEKTGSKKIYQLKYFSNQPELTIMYMPEAEATTGWNRWDTHERKARTRFKIYKDDAFILNYDQIDLEDIEFYLTSRVDRHLYLSMMPILEKIKAQRLKELAQEKEFMKFVVARNKDKFKVVNEEGVKKMVVDSVIWWKYKNKWKRPIKKDDTLALRMIERRILSPKYKPFQS